MKKLGNSEKKCDLLVWVSLQLQVRPVGVTRPVKVNPMCWISEMIQSEIFIVISHE